jgi:hypothetical protein
MTMTMPIRFLHVLIIVFLALQAQAYTSSSAQNTSNSSNITQKTSTDCRGARFYTFSWPMQKDCQFVPRGGTTTGTGVELETTVHPGWLTLQNPKLSKFERDRQAILAMAGPYQTSFDFLETVGYSAQFKPDKPYQSWGTEYIYVVEDKNDFISLQHIMVMFFKEGDKVHGPMVMKHWRQDWQYQKTKLFTYRGHHQWQPQELAKKVVKGTWAQAVYQVDDAPRYESYGTWEHNASFSSWRSQLTWRPLPRREHSVRNDYHVLEGFNRHTILPNGWVQEEENLKLKLDAPGRPAAHTPYVSKELGVNRYQRIKNFDFSAGHEYWQKTGQFWKIVREEWQTLSQQKSFKLKDKVNGRELYEPFFEYAEISQEKSPQDIQRFVRKTLADYVSP